MPAQIRPNRLDVNDRFPMLGFTIRTGGQPRLAEVAVATDPVLLKPDGKARRNPSNFHSSRAAGRLEVAGGEAVYVLPLNVLARFVGSEKLYVGLATAPIGGPAAFTVDVMPTADSPYVSIKALTGRSLRRLRVVPGRGRTNGGDALSWAGDAAQPGQQPATTPAPAPSTRDTASPSPADAHYDDGFGPLPAKTDAPPAPPASTTQGLVPSGRTAAPSQAMTIGIEDVDRAKRYAPQWADLFNWTTPPAVVSAVEARGFRVQRIADAAGDLNLDRYEVRVRNLPDAWPPERVLEYFRQNINTFLDTDNSEFSPYDASDTAKIASPDPVGAVWKIDIAGPRNAAVVISASTPTYFRVTTIHTPWSGDHPVTGHREFGFRREDGGKVVFYTRAADRDTSGILESISFMGADHLWKSFQRLFAVWAEQQGATAAIVPPFSERFHPEVVRILYGTAQSLGTGTSRAMAMVDLDYSPTDAASAAAALAAFSRRRDTWRAGVSDTRFMPHSAICHIEITQPDGQYVGTGFYVADDLILTAAHVVAQATSVTIYAGRNGAGSWLSKFTAAPADWSVYPGYADDRAHDMAVIRVTTPPPRGQHFSLEELSVSTDDPIIVCGYAAQGVDPLKQHLDADWIRELGDGMDTMLYNLQTTGGTSGAPVFYITAYEDEERRQSVSDIRVIGVHVSGATTTMNRACRLTATKIAWIQGRGLVSVAQGLASGPAEDAASIRERARTIGGSLADRVGQALDAGLATSALTPLLDTLARRRDRSGDTRGLALETFSLSWPVDVLAQPTSDTCWAASAAMVMAWDQSGDAMAQLVRARNAVAGYSGAPDVASTTAFANAVGLLAEPPQDYTEDGFRGLLQRFGPLWVGKRMADEFDRSSHAVVVTGMYSDGTNSYLYIADPWDRAPGSPDAPGAYAGTQNNGSRYVIRFDRFMREYDADQVAAGRQLSTMILHAAGTRGRVPNTDLVSQGQSWQPPRMAPPPPTGRALEALGSIDPVRSTDRTDRSGVTYVLEQLAGMRQPRTQAQAVVPLQEATVQVDDWPRMPDASGGTFGGVAVTWSYGGGQVGNVRVVPAQAAAADGWTLKVTGVLVDGPDGETDAGITVELRHCFTKAGEPMHRSLIKVILRGDGRHQRNNEWEPVAASPSTVGA